MKAITIWQPWAEFIAAGVKHNETRSWATKYRGPIAIHAAVKPIRQVVPLLSEKAFGLMVEKLEKASMANGELLTYFNYGEVIATAELVACHLITEEYLSTLPDTREELRDRMIIQVVNETKVLLYSGLLAERDRETLFEVNALLPRFEYGREYDQESFLISMQSCFKESDDREAVTMLASNIVNTQEATFSDNGTTQQAVMKTGITTKDNVLVPNPVNLIPYRTFLEVEQPASDFVFRVSEGRGGAPVFKLVAADGGVWKSQAVANVKAYLVEALKDIPDRDKITIIA